MKRKRKCTGHSGAKAEVGAEPGAGGGAIWGCEGDAGSAGRTAVGAQFGLESIFRMVFVQK